MSQLRVSRLRKSLWSVHHQSRLGGSVSETTSNRVAVGPNMSESRNQLRPLLFLPWEIPALISARVPQPTAYSWAGCTTCSMCLLPRQRPLAPFLGFQGLFGEVLSAPLRGATSVLAPSPRMDLSLRARRSHYGGPSIPAAHRTLALAAGPSARSTPLGGAADRRTTRRTADLRYPGVTTLGARRTPRTRSGLSATVQTLRSPSHPPERRGKAVRASP